MTRRVVPSLATGWSHARGRKSLRVVPCCWQATDVRVRDGGGEERSAPAEDSTAEGATLTSLRPPRISLRRHHMPTPPAPTRYREAGQLTIAHPLCPHYPPIKSAPPHSRPAPSRQQAGLGGDRS